MTAVAIVICLLTIPGFAFAAVLQLKSGQKVEGDFVGGTSSEVQIKVGSQVLKFNVNEIAIIVFDSTAFAQKQNSPKNSFSQAAKEVLRPLRAIDSVVEAGTNYNNYAPRVSDAKIKVDEFLREYSKSPIPEFNNHIAAAIAYYTEASTAWNAKVSKSFAEIPPNAYIFNCKECGEQTRTSQFWDVIAQFFVPCIWECARNEIIKAEQLVRN
jgi:hypothetical protein